MSDNKVCYSFGAEEWINASIFKIFLHHLKNINKFFVQTRFDGERYNDGKLVPETVIIFKLLDRSERHIGFDNMGLAPYEWLEMLKTLGEFHDEVFLYNDEQYPVPGAQRVENV